MFPPAERLDRSKWYNSTTVKTVGVNNALVIKLTVQYMGEDSFVQNYTTDIEIIEIRLIRLADHLIFEYLNS